MMKRRRNERETKQIGNKYIYSILFYSILIRNIDSNIAKIDSYR